MPTTVYIVEDNQDMRLIIKKFLQRCDLDIQVVGESETAEKASIEIPELDPDFALVDISLPGMDGLELIRLLRDKLDHVHWILVVTGHDIELYKDSAVKAGADDIVSKDNLKTLIEKITSILRKGKKGN